MITQAFRNPILNTDSYKISHYHQYPDGTTNLFSYWESRGSKIDGINETVFVGLQYFIKEYFLRPITREDIEEAASIFAMHFNDPNLFNREGWEIILNEYDGYLPIRIRAVPEGTVVPLSNVMLTVENTDDRLPWLTNYVETILCQLWHPTTVATYSWHTKNIIRRYMEETCDTLDGLDFKLHDFGFRGVSSVESAAIGGFAHLVNFRGTDTIVAIEMAMRYYNATGLIAGSIPAAEHSTVTSWGPSKDDEDRAFRNMVETFGSTPTGLYAVVSDSYDYFNAVYRWAHDHKELVLSKDNILVVRPDSGDPVECIVRGAKILDSGFGSTINSRGYKVLNHVRLIQGDGIDHTDVEKILEALTSAGYSAENVAFGMGGGLLQKHNRDTFRFAFKASSITINGVDRSVFKKPSTDAGKSSKAGRLMLAKDENGTFVTKLQSGWNGKDYLQTVYENGKLLVDDDFETIRSRVNEQSQVLVVNT